MKGLFLQRPGVTRASDHPVPRGRWLSFVLFIMFRHASPMGWLSYTATKETSNAFLVSEVHSHSRASGSDPIVKEGATPPTPTVAFVLTIVNHQLLCISYQSPIVNYQSSTTITHHQSSTINYQYQYSYHQSSITNNQTPHVNHESLLISYYSAQLFQQ